MQGFERIEYILESFLGEPKNGTSSAQQQYNCPCCAQENNGIPDGKYNLEVNISKGVYQCWRCCETHNTKGSLGSLIKKYGGYSLYKQYKEEIDLLVKIKYYSLDESAQILNSSDNEPTIIKLPKTFKKINLSNYCKIPVREYLEKRNIDQETIDKFNIGYTEWETDDKDWSYRIIIPSYDEFGELNFFVGRDYTNNDKRPKYKNCKRNKTEIIFQENLIDWDAPIYLCEGVFDCLRLPNCISLLGKHLSKNDFLYYCLMNKANSDIIICLDGDTEISETKKIYKLLNNGKHKNKIKYIRLGEENIPYKDFSEIYESLGKKGMINAIAQTQEFSDFDLSY